MMKCENVKMLPISSSNSNWKLATLVLATLATMATFAKTFDWRITGNDTQAAQFAAYHGETVRFNLIFSGAASNLAAQAIYYQTNGMGRTYFPPIPGTVFHPTNDCGAAVYRFFIRCTDPDGINYSANGLLRLLDSPGFEPSVVELPVKTLDFDLIDVLHAPWATPDDLAAAADELHGAVDTKADATKDVVTTRWRFDATGLILEPDADDIWAADDANYMQYVADRGVYRWTLAGYGAGLCYGGADAAALTNATGTAYTFTRQAETNQYDVAYMDDVAASTPADYATISNRAMTALQSYTEIDPTVPTWAKANTKPIYTASEVGATTAEDVYRIVAGTNIVLVVTNYNSATHAPAMKLQHLDPQSGEYVTYWDEQRRHGLTLTSAMDYTDAAAATELSRADAAYAPRAWSGTTSGLGADAPAGVTWISTPETVIAGGYEYEKIITTAGAVWVLTSNGMTAGATTNSFFRVAASDGTELFSIEKTDSYLVGVPADGITKSGNTVTIPLNVVAPSHPYIRATTNLVNAVWTKENEDGFTCPWATVSWSGTIGAYVATVTCSEPQAFFYFEYLVEGGAKIKNSATVEMTGGIYFNGDRYMPVVNGSKLEFIRQ